MLFLGWQTVTSETLKIRVPNRVTPEEVTDGELCEQYATRICILFKRGMFDCARKLIDELEEIHYGTEEVLNVNSYLAELGINNRTCNILEKNKILTIRDLINTPEEQLRATPDLGDKALKEFNFLLKQNGFSFKFTKSA